MAQELIDISGKKIGCWFENKQTTFIWAIV